MLSHSKIAITAGLITSFLLSSSSFAADTEEPDFEGRANLAKFLELVKTSKDETQPLDLSQAQARHHLAKILGVDERSEISPEDIAAAFGENPDPKKIKQAIRQSMENDKTAYVDGKTPWGKQVAMAQQGHGALYVTVDTVRFFSAVAIMEFWNCYHKQDPMICSAFLSSLKDPMTYIGWLTFVWGAEAVNSRVQSYLITNEALKLAHVAGAPKGVEYMMRSLGPALGMAAGMWVSELLSEIYMELKTEGFFSFNNCGVVNGAEKSCEFGSQEYLRRREEILWKFYQKTFSKSQWWKDKLIGLNILLAAGKLQQITIKNAQKAMAWTEHRLARAETYFVAEAAKDGRFVGKIARQIPGTGRVMSAGGKKLMATLRGASLQGIRVLFKKGALVPLKITPVMAVGSSIVELLLFLGFDHVLTDIFMPPIHAYRNMSARREAIEALDVTIKSVLKSDGSLESQEVLAERARVRKEDMERMKNEVSELQAKPNWVRSARESAENFAGRQLQDGAALVKEIREEDSWWRNAWAPVKLIGHKLWKTVTSVTIKPGEVTPPPKNLAEIKERTVTPVADLLKTRKLGKDISRLEKIGDGELASVESAILDVQEAWRKYREFLLSTPMQTMASYQMEVAQLKSEFERTQAYYMWFLKYRMNPELAFWRGEQPVDSLDPWYTKGTRRSGEVKEYERYLYAFFCSPYSPNKSIVGGGNRLALGKPKLGEKHFKTKLYRVAQFTHTCLWDRDLGEDNDEDLDAFYEEATPSWERFVRELWLPVSERQPEFALPHGEPGLGRAQLEALKKAIPLYQKSLAENPELANEHLYKLSQRMTLAEERFGVAILDLTKQYWFSVQKSLEKSLGDASTPMTWWTEKYWPFNEDLDRVLVREKGVISSYLNERLFWNSMAERYASQEPLKTLFEKAASTATAGHETTEQLRQFLKSPDAVRNYLAAQEAMSPENIKARCARDLGESECQTRRTQAWLANQELIWSLYLHGGMGGLSDDPEASEKILGGPGAPVTLEEN